MSQGAPIGRLVVIVAIVGGVGAAVLAGAALLSPDDEVDVAGSAPAVEVATDATAEPSDAATPLESGEDPDPEATTTSSTTTTAPTTTLPYDGWVDPASVGRPYSTEVNGVLTFRGNPTRTYHGAGPVPSDPEILWRYPSTGGLCGDSTVGGETRTWCGTGWTGQPAVWELDGRLVTAFGAYDKQVHLLEADTGERVIEPFTTGDIIKGTVTIDPDGYPLLYTGSRDNYLRILSFDQGGFTELWRLSADAFEGGIWNNDWDGSPLVIDDHLFQGGENSLFYIVKLNRGYDADGNATVSPEILLVTPGYDQALLDAVGRNVSIESSVAIHENTVYFANSGGLISGFDLTGLAEGETPTRSFRYWAGDDIDATIVIDTDGFLYVGAEYERGNARSQEVGQILKLDPSLSDPLVWSVPVRDYLGGGVWATPALHRDLVIVPTDGGDVLAIDRETGEIRWTLDLPGPLWSSPTIVDDVYLQGDCNGTLHAFDVSDTSVAPPELWSIEVGGCIESSPGVYGGRIVVGTRSGGVYGFG